MGTDGQNCSLDSVTGQIYCFGTGTGSGNGPNSGAPVVTNPTPAPADLPNSSARTTPTPNNSRGNDPVASFYAWCNQGSLNWVACARLAHPVGQASSTLAPVSRYTNTGNPGTGLGDEYAPPSGDPTPGSYNEFLAIWDFFGRHASQLVQNTGQSYGGLYQAARGLYYQGSYQLWNVLWNPDVPPIEP
jgi:hypothetical protein